MNKCWFKIDLEHDEENPEILHHVLSTSHDGLSVLISDLRNVYEKNKLGRFEIDTSTYDSDFDVPYKFIELHETPEINQPESESDWESRFVLMGLGLVILLAIYGAYSLISILLF